MGSFCRKGRVHPVTSVTVSSVRRNGWSLPWHPLQAVAWFFIPFFAVSFFAFMIPHLPTPELMWITGICNASLLVCHVVTHVVSVSCDPADDSVLLKRREEGSSGAPAFDRKKHEHVIENQFCYICEVSVGPKSKHCSVCNKCVADFDHHCKWLNNCVGSKNYRLFLVCVSTAFLGSLIIFAVSVLLTLTYFNPGTWLNSSRGPAGGDNGTTPLHKMSLNSSRDTGGGNINSKPSISQPGQSGNSTMSMKQGERASRFEDKTANQRTDISTVRQKVWIAVVMLSSLLSLITLLLLGHLLSFHLYLYCTDQSTYEFIVKRRHRNKSSSQKSKSNANAIVSCEETVHSSVEPKFRCTACSPFWVRSKAVSRNSSKRSHPEDGEDKNSRCETSVSVPKAKSTTRGEEEKSAVQKAEIVPAESSTWMLEKNKNGRLQSGASGKMRPLESVRNGSHGNVYLGSPQRRMSADRGVNRFPLSPLPSDADKEVLFEESNRWKQIGHKITPMPGKCAIPEPFFIRAEKESNEREAPDSHHLQLVEPERRDSLMSNARLSRISNQSGTWANSDLSFARNQRTRRKKELLRQKSQEQIISKQRYFQQRVFQIEELTNHRQNIDTRSLDDALPAPHTTADIRSLPWTAGRGVQRLQGNDGARDSVSDRDSLTSDPASPYLTFESANERIRRIEGQGQRQRRQETQRPPHSSSGLSATGPSDMNNSFSTADLSSDRSDSKGCGQRVSSFCPTVSSMPGSLSLEALDIGPAASRFDSRPQDYAMSPEPGVIGQPRASSALSNRPVSQSGRKERGDVNGVVSEITQNLRRLADMIERNGYSGLPHSPAATPSPSGPRLFGPTLSGSGLEQLAPLINLDPIALRNLEMLARVADRHSPATLTTHSPVPTATLIPTAAASASAVSPCISPMTHGSILSSPTPPNSSTNTPTPPVVLSRQGKVNIMQIRCKFGQLGSSKGQFSSPHGFCLGMDEEIVIADTNNHRICVYDKTGEFRSSFGNAGKDEGQLWYPRKVAFIRTANALSSPRYVICDRGSERSRMQIFTRSGHFIRKIAIRYIDIVAGLAITPAGHIVAVDSVSPTVFVIAETGDLLRWFDCSEHMREPSDVAVANGEFYICDFKGHCVVVFSEEGQFMRRIGFENLTNFPNGIDVSDAGDILIGDSHGNRFHVVVFDKSGALLGEFECPYVKVSRCCGLKITSEGYVVTLAKNNHHVLILNTLYIM